MIELIAYYLSGTNSESGDAACRSPEIYRQSTDFLAVGN
jgi:hypothetical protein